jgi:glycosyltransferase involved in cell wall biosynthesis
MNKPFISAIIITKNEGKNIERCLKSISWVDEIIVVDSQSTDKTAEIARKFTPQVFIHPWPGYSQQKNFALEKAKGEWVLSVDSDEVIEEKLKAEILAVLSSSPAYGGFYIPRKNFIGKRWIRFGGWYPDYTLRLFKREAGRFGKRMVHEEIIVTGNKGYLTIPILHYTYQSLQDYFQRQLQYARLAGEEMLAQGKKATIFDLIFRPAYSFFKSYLFRLGVLEGHLGLFLSILSSFYVFMKYAYTHFYEDFN